MTPRERVLRRWPGAWLRRPHGPRRPGWIVWLPDQVYGVASPTEAAAWQAAAARLDDPRDGGGADDRVTTPCPGTPLPDGEAGGGFDGRTDV